MTIEQKNHMNGNAKPLSQKPPERDALSPSAMVGKVCPFIGLEDDPSTHLLFASPAAFCHRAEPIGAVALDHQQEYCLTSTHKICPVFTRAEWNPLPTAIEYQEMDSPQADRRWLWFLFGLAALGIVVGLYFFGGNGRFSTPVETEPNREIPAVITNPTDTPAPTITLTPTSLPTKTAVATKTISPTATNTLMSTWTPSAAETSLPLETAVAVQGEVTTPRLNIRLGPSTDYAVIDVVDQGLLLDVVGQSIDGAWLQICCVAGESGWVFSTAILLPEASEDRIPVVRFTSSVPTDEP